MLGEAEHDLAQLQPWERDPLLLSAIHESGHIVAARAFGRDVALVRLHSNGSCVETQYFRSSPELTRENLIVLYSGSLAVKGYAQRKDAAIEWWSGSVGDCKMLDVEIQTLYGLLGDNEARMEEHVVARRRAAALVQRRWKHIVATAVTLLQFHREMKAAKPITLDELDKHSKTGERSYGDENGHENTRENRPGSQAGRVPSTT